MRNQFDPSIYFILDPHECAYGNFISVALMAVEGGVTMIQYRNKVDDKIEIAAQAAALAEFLKSEGIAFLVNDHVDIAHAVDADGAHIGQGDMNPKEARKILGQDKILGLTAFTEEQIKAVDPDIIDYIGTGPFFPTKTDKGKPVLGAERFAALAKLSPVPVVGIGGITPGNAMDVMAAGANGVAMMRSISESEDPCRVAEEFAIVLRK